MSNVTASRTDGKDLDNINALSIVPEATGQGPCNDYDTGFDTSEYPYGKGQGMLVHTEKQVIKKEKHRLAFHISDEFRCFEEMTFFLKKSVLLIAILMLTPVVVSMVYEDGINKGVSDHPGLTLTSLLINVVIPFVCYTSAGIHLFAVLKKIFRIEKSGEKQKIKEKTSEVHVPYPDELGMKNITDSHQSL